MSDPAPMNAAPPHRPLFDKLILSGPMPALIVGIVLAITAFFSFFLKDFQMDASPDSIVIENDKDLRYYNHSRQLFGTDDYVVVILPAKSREELFSDKYLKIIRELTDDLKKMKHVESLMSILDVPLFHSPDVPLVNVAKGYKTLGKDADRGMAIKELIESPLYSDYLISKDGTTTAIMINFDPDQDFMKMSAERQALQIKRDDGPLSPDEKVRLKELDREYETRHAELSEQRRRDIAEMRAIMAKHEKQYPEIGRLHLGGVPMMIADMIDYIEHDIIYFGAGVILFMIITLSAIYRSFKWVLLPMATCLATALVMIGCMSLLKWQTTVVTSNFSSLLLILTLSSAVHIISHYRELQSEHPELSQRPLISLTVREVITPCFYMVLTTIVGFASLILSGIRPVMDFGIMMTWGLALSFFMCFVFLPAALALFPKGKPVSLVDADGQHNSRMMPLAAFTGKRPYWVGAIAVAAFIFLCVGTSRLSVEARFIDYFRKDTPIFESITLLDERMGGAMPLEVTLEGEGKDYWLDPTNLDRLARVHQFIDDLPETAKVISPQTMRAIIQGVNKGNPVSKAMLNMARNALPKEFYRYIVQPYATPDFDQARIMIRVRESDKSLNRMELRNKITTFLNDEMHLEVDKQSHITGYFILYNNMLRSLFNSQIKTVSMVFLTVWIMFALLFRSPWVATIGLVPNVLAVTLILGAMGWLNIRLDMMTVMIAAITFGMADDNTIHYLHRFKQEFAKDRDYHAAMHRTHNTIGRPLSYTMLTTVAGFAILGFSNFVPTAYFGLFTGLAMFAALLAAHTILPMLIITLKPFGKGSS